VNPAVEAVSVFFPCYNDEATIARMVEVVVATIGRIGVDDAEVIVVNDGSSDRSAAILDDLSSREPLLRVVTHEHSRRRDAHGDWAGVSPLRQAHVRVADPRHRR